ncbi:MAG: hypothetical protein EBY07_04720 [Actinobacteria bacterium]|nr:hypothetical protein [Actinomycetota bacterium]
MSDDLVLCERRADGVAVVTLNNPKVNALSQAVLARLREVVPRLVGASRAKEIVITGRQVKSDEALRIGLADEVVPNETLHERAFALAASVAAGAVQAHAAMKRAIDEGLSSTLADGLLLERRLFTDIFRTDDSQVGVKSFLENGPGKATFSGR